MAGRTLEEYFVSLGIKGQNTVLKNIDKVKKKASDLSKKKTNIKLGTTGAGGVFGQNMVAPHPSPEQKAEENKTSSRYKQFSKAVNSFSNSTKSIRSSVESFDPVGTVKNIVTATGEALSNITVAGFGVGNLPKGIAELTNSMVSMAAGAVEMAKSSAATQYGITNRNTLSDYYSTEKNGDKTAIGQSNLSNAQFSELIMTISGSYGRIGKPMQEILNELTTSKNTNALSQVASGNWASTGTDKGWMLQQISNQTAGLPPSIAQAIQTSLLKSNKDEIMNKGGEEGAQSSNKYWQNSEEERNRQIYNATSDPRIQKLNEQLISMQVSMIETGAGFAIAITDATEAIKGLPEKMKNFQSSLDSLTQQIYDKSFGHIDIRRGK